jgi:hypothetical protein
MLGNFWSGLQAVAVALLLLLLAAYGLLLAGEPLPAALAFGWLMSGVVCLAVGAWRRTTAWAICGFFALGGALVAVLIAQGVANWWWPLGLVLLGVAYVPLAFLLSGRLAAAWRPALESSALLVAGAGAIWELGQIIIFFILLSQGAPLLADDANALNASFALSSLLLFGGSLLWAALHRRLIALALSGLLAGQLAIALVINATAIGNPSEGTLLALALLVVALACQVGTYPLRFLLPDLAPGERTALWRLFMQRRGNLRAALAVKSVSKPEAWGLCLLLDSLALLFTLASVPLADLLAADAPDVAAQVIVFSAGILLSITVAYWQNTPWLLLLGGFFLATDLQSLGNTFSNPPLAWPLLYLVATILLLVVAVYLKERIERFWVWATLLVAAGTGVLALSFAFQRQSIAWGLGIAAALAAAALLAYWAWRQHWLMSQRP